MDFLSTLPIVTPSMDRHKLKKGGLKLSRDMLLNSVEQRVAKTVFSSIFFKPQVGNC